MTLITAEDKRLRATKLLMYTAVFAAILVCLYLLFSRFGVGFPCIFRKLTGLRCPGCGNTHAVQALLHLNLHEAIRCNYAFPLELAYILWVYSVSSASYLKGGRFNYIAPFRAADITVLVTLLAWTVVRNIIKV